MDSYVIKWVRIYDIIIYYLKCPTFGHWESYQVGSHVH